jgi:hypothetical protein
LLRVERFAEAQNLDESNGVINPSALIEGKILNVQVYMDALMPKSNALDYKKNLMTALLKRFELTED